MKIWVFGKVVWEWLFRVFLKYVGGEKCVKMCVILFKMWKYEFKMCVILFKIWKYEFNLANQNRPLF